MYVTVRPVSFYKKGGFFKKLGIKGARYATSKALTGGSKKIWTFTQGCGVGESRARPYYEESGVGGNIFEESGAGRKNLRSQEKKIEGVGVCKHFQAGVRSRKNIEPTPQPCIFWV